MLDASLFAGLKADDRRKLLLSLTGASASPAEVAKRLKAKGIDLALFEKVKPLLRSGFSAMVGQAKDYASEARGAWKAITGENYGSEKANGWEPEAPPVIVSEEELESARAELRATAQDLDEAQQTLGSSKRAHAEAQARASRITALRETAALADRRRNKLATDEANQDEWSEKVMAAEAAASGDARADHRLHLRCEVSHPQTLEVFRELVEHPLVQLVSVMDHAPGQRQFARLEKYREYYQGKYHLSDAEMDAFIVEQVANSERYSDAARAAIVDVCQGRGLSVASHDDATLAHVRESAGYGMAIAEFPTTVEAARASHEHGLQVLMGAPNVVRGGSHSGNVAAAQLAGIGVLDILSSDYYPASLLHAALLLAGEHSEYDAIRYDLPRAVAMVSRTPALAAGLTDRGEIRVGLRADLLQARALGNNQPVVRQVWRGGQRVF